MQPLSSALPHSVTELTPTSTGHHRAPHEPRESQEISGASQRLRALATLSGSLTDSLTPEDAASLVERKALSALGATSAVVVTLGNFPPSTSGSMSPAQSPGPAMLTVVHAIGLRKEVKAALEQLPLDAPVPLAEVAREGQPLFLASDAELGRYPDWSATVIAAGVHAAAIVPVWANGELRGVLGLTWPAARAFDDDERAFVLTLGVMCAQAILRAHLRAAELHAREEAERANRSKTQFLTMISHELRTPMNAVIGYTDLLSDEISGPISELQKSHLARVRSSGTHLLGLIEELLNYARTDAGADVVIAESVRLVDIVEESLNLVRPAADQKGLTIRVEAPEKPIELHTDPRKLRQILVNLIANAVKFTDAGDVVVVLRVAGLDADIRVYIEVTDTGRGIAPADEEHIFDAFWQGDSRTPHVEGGTGLGLPVARQLARLLGGDVTVMRTAVGFGSTFVVSLPERYGGRFSGG